MPSLRLEDDQTIQAIGILADVLDRFSGVTSLECTLVSKALRQVQQTRSQIGMDFASRAFATLEPEIRRQIADDAADAAIEATNSPKLPNSGAPPSQPGADGPAGRDQQSRRFEKPQAVLSAIALLGTVSGGGGARFLRHHPVTAGALCGIKPGIGTLDQLPQRLARNVAGDTHRQSDGAERDVL